MEETEKWIQYAALINAQIGEMFQDDANNHIDPTDFEDPENLKQFFHALSTAVPSTMFNHLTGDNKNHLEYNHVANKLCFEYCTKEE